LDLTYADYLESLGKIEKVKKLYEKLLPKHHPLIYIQYIRFARRCLDMRDARRIFYNIIKMQNCSYQVYVANAEIELYANNSPKVAHYIYEMAFKQFNNSTKFLLLYVDFLFRQGDSFNVRSLLEKILNQITLDKAQEVWSSYHKYERLCGTLENMDALEKRKVEAYKIDPLSMGNLVERYRYLDLWPCSSSELVNFEQPNASREKLQSLSQTTGGLFLSNKEAQEFRLGSHQKNINKEKLAKPDLSKLVVFNPDSMNQSFSLGNGDSISLPATVTQFINAISRPKTIHGKKWEGVKIDIPALMNMIADSTLKDPRDSEQIRKKRKLDDHEGMSKMVTDIYRERQTKKSKNM